MGEAVLQPELTDGRGIVMMQDFPLDRFDREGTAIAYIGLGAHLGQTMSQNKMGHILGQVNHLPLEPGQRLRVRASFCELGVRDPDKIFIGDRPQSLVEHPVSILRQGNSVARVVVAAIGELVDVCGINHRAASDRRQAMAMRWLIGFARVLTDRVYRATLWDVVVHPDYQKRGVGEELVNRALAHPVLSKVEKFWLNTRDKFGFYEKFGFVRSDQGMVRAHSPQVEKWRRP